MEALEGIARKAVWAWRERKQEVLLGAAAVGTAAAVVWWLSQPAPKQGVDPAELQATLEAKYDAAVQQGKVIPLATKPHIVVNDGVQVRGPHALRDVHREVSLAFPTSLGGARSLPCARVGGVPLHGLVKQSLQCTCLVAPALVCPGTPLASPRHSLMRACTVLGGDCWRRGH